MLLICRLCDIVYGSTWCNPWALTLFINQDKKLASIVESKSGTPDRWREGGGGCPFGKSLAMTCKMGDI